MDQQERTQQPWDDPGLLAPLPILQQTSSDCGVACLAMAANVTYASALYVFDELGLEQKRKGRAVYSSNFLDILPRPKGRGFLLDGDVPPREC